MTEITAVRPVLLSAPYAHEDDAEVTTHLQSGYRTTGLVEVSLEDGTTGLGEGYLAVFAPRVFERMVELVAPSLVGKPVEDVGARYDEVCETVNYWSRRGAARHVVSAVEIALLDAKAKALGVPAYDLLGGKRTASIRIYASGGDSETSDRMTAEFDRLEERDIDVFKIRARTGQSRKAIWSLEEGLERDVDVAIDMSQGLARHPQNVSDVVHFVERIRDASGADPFFLEEPVGPFDLDAYRLLRRRLSCKIAGGETVTTGRELRRLVVSGAFDVVQPDATVVGGVSPVLALFERTRDEGTTVVVHCWGGPVSVMANYHAAFAGGGQLAEWPMKRYELREAMFVEELDVDGGRIDAPTAPGFGVELTDGIAERYPFREDAVYRCLPDAEDEVDESEWQ